MCPKLLRAVSGGIETAQCSTNAALGVCCLAGMWASPKVRSPHRVRRGPRETRGNNSKEDHKTAAQKA
eukprot:1574742-Alexandrium_andersonii.AAC.1